MSDPTYQLATQVEQLTRPYIHREAYEYENNGTRYQTFHFTKVPSLLTQLDQLEHAAAGDNDGGAPQGFKSRPAARLEALDTLIDIDRQAARWIRNLGEDDPVDTAACILRLHGLQAAQPDETRRHIAADIRHWWTAARVMTGWDKPAWRPNNTCPICSTPETVVKGTLRVRVADQIAHCINCSSVWDETTIGLLADHIRTENAEPDDQQLTA